MTWRAGLPIRILREGYTFDPVAAAPVRTEMEGGPTRQRGRPSVPIVYAFTLRFYSASEVATFQDMVRTDFANGSSSFQAAFWTPDDGDNAPATRTWQFKTTGQPKQQGRVWAVDAEVERLS
jgi:hypothetical protein